MFEELCGQLVTALGFGQDPDVIDLANQPEWYGPEGYALAMSRWELVGRPANGKATLKERGKLELYAA